MYLFLEVVIVVLKSTNQRENDPQENVVAQQIHIL